MADQQIEEDRVNGCLGDNQSSHSHALIDDGLYWNKQLLTVEKYDPSCRRRQCFKCQQYGHIGPQYHSAERCSWCITPHNTRSCLHSKDESTLKCSNCSASHPAWSKTCEVRLKENRKGKPQPRES